MHESVTAIPSLGPRSVLVVRTKADMHPMFPEFQIIHVHTEQFPQAESPLFEHETDQAISEAGGISVGLVLQVNTVNKALEILFSNGLRDVLRLFEFEFRSLDPWWSMPGMSQQIALREPLTSRDIHIHDWGRIKVSSSDEEVIQGSDGLENEVDTACGQGTGHVHGRNSTHIAVRIAEPDHEFGQIRRSGL